MQRPMTYPMQMDRLLSQVHRLVLVGSKVLDKVLGSVQTFAILAVLRCLLKLCTLFGPQQRLAGGHQYLLVVKIGHLGHLPMYPFVDARQV
jgi:hypothetical protein